MLHKTRVATPPRPVPTPPSSEAPRSDTGHDTRNQQAIIIKMQGFHVAISCSLAAILVILAGVPSASGDDVIMQKRSDTREDERSLEPRRKRPFCNAFTGCGKKRSDESMATLLELNSEPAVEELTRQIMSEAKLWEAIQEARIELIRRRHQQLLTNQISDRPLPFTAFRKRRSVNNAPPKAAPQDNDYQNINHQQLHATPGAQRTR